MLERKLIDYLPPVERDIAEFDAILTMAEQPEMSTSWDAVHDVLNDQFISDATENGVSRFEKIMNIIPKATESLDSRKFTLLARVSEQPPFTITTLKKQLETLCGEDNYEVFRDVDAKILYVRIAIAAKSDFNDVGILLNRVVPANMEIDLSVKYIQHDALSEHTHEILQNFTHEQIRNEVI
jgi:hypothetical protein